MPNFFVQPLILKWLCHSDTVAKVYQNSLAHGHGHALFGEQVVIHAASRKEKIPEWKDWHDYNLIEAESKRTGPGEQGQAVQLTEHEREDAAYKGNGYVTDTCKNVKIKKMDSTFLFLIE